jgi:hypothetical protein
MMSLMAALIAVIGVSCQTTSSPHDTGPHMTYDKLAARPVPLVTFHQEDIQVVAQKLSAKMDCAIELSDEVKALSNIYVDYRLSQPAPLGKVLDEINNYIRKEHKIIFRWKQQDNKIIIYKY